MGVLVVVIGLAVFGAPAGILGRFFLILAEEEFPQPLQQAVFTGQAGGVDALLVQRAAVQCVPDLLRGQQNGAVDILDLGFGQHILAVLGSGSCGSHAGTAGTHHGDIHIIGGVLALGGGNLAVVIVGVHTGSGQGSTDCLQQTVAGEGGGCHGIHSDGVVLHHLGDHLVKGNVAHASGLLLFLHLNVGDGSVVVQRDGNHDDAVAALAGAFVGTSHGAGCGGAAGTASAASQQREGHGDAQQHRDPLLAHDSSPFLCSFFFFCPCMGDSDNILTEKLTQKQ